MTLVLVLPQPTTIAHLGGCVADQPQPLSSPNWHREREDVGRWGCMSAVPAGGVTSSHGTVGSGDACINPFLTRRWM